MLDRTLHLVDIENLLTVPPRDANGGHYVSAAKAFWAAVGPRPDDHLVIGCDFANMFKAGDALHRGQLVCGHGPDGGENAILDHVRPGFIRSHYGRVVIASGDHAFIPLAERLLLLGVEVQSACIPGCGSSALRELLGPAIPILNFASEEPARHLQLAS